MKLSAWLEAQEISASRFAEIIGRSVSTVTRAAKGEVMPDRETMRLISEATDGAVLPNDFYDLPGGPREGEAA